VVARLRPEPPVLPTVRKLHPGRGEAYRVAPRRGRCAFVSEAGRRCTERSMLEFHHLVPWAAGGPATPGNIQLRCRAHNGYEAVRYFGGGGPWTVREPGVTYSICRPVTRAGPSCSARCSVNLSSWRASVSCRVAVK
jgi:hypothetical protein